MMNPDLPFSPASSIARPNKRAIREWVKPQGHYTFSAKDAFFVGKQPAEWYLRALKHNSQQEAEEYLKGFTIPGFRVEDHVRGTQVVGRMDFLRRRPAVLHAIEVDLTELADVQRSHSKVASISPEQRAAASVAMYIKLKKWEVYKGGSPTIITKQSGGQDTRQILRVVVKGNYDPNLNQYPQIGSGYQQLSGPLE